MTRLRRYARVLAVRADAADDLVVRTLAEGRRGRRRRAAEARQTEVARTPGSPIALMAIMHRLHGRRRGSDDRDAPPRQTVETFGAARTPTPGIVAMLWQLPTDEREVLLLVAVECLAYEDVADLLGVPAATVMARLASARAHLRALMRPPSGTG